jgi:replicative DNA helicase
MDEPRRFADWVLEVCPDAGDVVVDSVKDMVPGVAKDEVGAALNMAWQELIARGVELMLLHHQRKAQQGTPRVNALDDVYGSTWLTSGLGSVFALDGDPGAQIVKLKHLKPVVMQLDDTQIRHDHHTGTTTVHDSADVELIDVVRQAGDAGVTALEAAQNVVGAAGTAELQKVKRELNKLVKTGSVEKIQGTRTAKGAEPDRWRVRAELAWAASLNV